MRRSFEEQDRSQPTPLADGPWPAMRGIFYRWKREGHRRRSPVL